MAIRPDPACSIFTRSLAYLQAYATWRPCPRLHDHHPCGPDAEIGSIERFSSSHRLTAYAGLVPTTRSSGGRTSHGGTGHASNRWLKWILVEIVQTLQRGGAAADTGALRVEQRVTVWSDDIVLDSCPVQTAARRIILEDGR